MTSKSDADLYKCIYKVSDHADIPEHINKWYFCDDGKTQVGPYDTFSQAKLAVRIWRWLKAGSRIVE